MMCGRFQLGTTRRKAKVMAVARPLAFILGTLLACPPLLAAPAVSSKPEWRSYGHDAGGMRHSPLRQITPENVQDLAPAWTFHMRPPSLDIAAANPQPVSLERGRPASRYIGSEMTPLVANGLMILATPYRRIVALDATAGTQV